MRGAVIHIETATADDIPALCALLAVLFSQELEFTPDPAAQTRGLVRIIDNPDAGTVLVARRGSDIRGMVSLLYTESTALGGKVALLEDMVVFPEDRGTGIGSRLLARAISVARVAGCRRVTLLTDQENSAARRFYERHGFEPSPMVPFRLRLR